MAIKLNQLDTDKYGQVVNKDGIISYQPGTGGLGTIPEPTPAPNTRVGEIASYTSPGQQAQAVHAVTKNNAKKAGTQLFNMEKDAGMTAAGNGTATLLDKKGHGTTAKVMQNATPNTTVATPITQDNGNYDIGELTDKLTQQQEAERAKFERKRMSDRIARMGFALGNLVGAKGGTTDASAITLDDGTKQVNEYRKDMEEINKQNMDAYQRALNLIYHGEEQDLKERNLAATIADREARLAETAAYHDAMNQNRQSQLELNEKKAEEAARHNKAGEENQAARIAKTGSGGSGSSLAEYELVEENVYDRNGKKVGTKKVRRRIGSGNSNLKPNPMSGGTTTGNNGKKKIAGF